MRALMMGVLAAALGACAPAARDVSIIGLDLADGTTLASLQDALPVDDRAALGTYALLHWPKSKFYCGEPIGGRDTPAATVGEAIAQTKAYEAKLAAAQAQTRNSPTSPARAEEAALITRMEQIVFERDMLYARMGRAADTTPRGVEMTRQLDQMRTELEQLRGGAQS